MRDRLRAMTARVPRTYWYVWAGTLVNRLGGFIVPLLTIYLMRERGLDADEAGGIVMFFGAGQVVASIVGGQLTDRVGRRTTMLISLFGGAIAMVALGRARDVEEITVLVAVVGFVGELYRPAVFAFVADTVEEKDRQYAYGLLYWAINFGFGIASALGGLVADFDFSLLFYLDAATTLCYGVIVAMRVPETRPIVTEREQPTTSQVSPLGDLHYVIFIGIAFLGSLLPMQAGATLSAHMTSQGYAASTYGLVLAVNGLVIVALQPLLTKWSERYDASRVLALSMVLYAFGLYAHGLAGIALAHAGAVVVWTVAEILESPTKSTLVAAMAPVVARGRYQGLLVMTWGLAQMLGPKLGTWVWQHEGPSVIWTGCFAIGLATAALYLVTSPARKRRLARGR